LHIAHICSGIVGVLYLCYLVLGNRLDSADLCIREELRGIEHLGAGADAPFEQLKFTLIDAARERDLLFRRADLLPALIQKIDGIVNVLLDRKSTRLNSSHVKISYAVFCLKKK